MTPTRRQFLVAGGGLVAALAMPPTIALGGEPIVIRMAGRRDGSHVWFDPVGVHVQPGLTVRWINFDAGNAHTATAYHPANFDRPRRIPPAAAAWDSDYLLPDQSFAVTLTEPGVYDYYCVPHEHAGMVGRIVVGEPGDYPWTGIDEGLPEVALRAFPPVEEIIEKGVVRHAGAADHRRQANAGSGFPSFV